ncbi:inosine monophosphate dehydrogenase [Trichoderma longibrachiatum ATCC 18648]|uniref:Inosine monophosphate dehydrogenase n=1 Tax=Trichoderma longibrachiatum ATCC 18648 TaxID=983965 RepID=A0A2T4CA50_TRILO|nr:inosine monophosphate dehydrogenase [Trichoderma longibrachiatum ATCC 18648]
MSSNKMQQWFPWTEAPVIVNAPMAGAVSPELAAEVSKAGGLGFLACIADFSEGSHQVIKLDVDLIKIRQLLSSPSSSATTPAGHLRIGVGFLTCHPSIAHFAATALPIVKKHRPAAVWLFAPHERIRPQGEIVRLLKGLGTAGGEGEAPRVFVQVGNVAAAREAIADGADAVVCQGTDAGGHQFRRGMGVVPLLGETRRLVDDEEKGGHEGVCVLAAGGIADGKGVAAMMTLEADAVVLGTRVCYPPTFERINSKKKTKGPAYTLTCTQFTGRGDRIGEQGAACGRDCA